MVKICSITNYPSYNDNKYKSYFEKYPYELSIFQKYAFEGIIEGNHVLVTAATGSGKTLPAEFAIEHFVSIGKKVIYTSPIKALSNQKFYEFTKKFPHISFGILTGDIKTNPEADVLIVTAEILLNKLFQNNSNSSQKISSNISFDMDINNDLACVIMDEVHYINDPERGHVWENTIMMLPKHVQMLMLSATIDQPEMFAYWCENKGNTIQEKSEKNVYLTTTNKRIVPLTHYNFITTNNGIFKVIKDKTIHEEIKSNTNKLFVIQNDKGEFDEKQYYKMTKMLQLFESKNIFIKRSHVINQVLKYCVENEILPALCFVLSRKQLEFYANEITVNLLEFDSKVPYIAKHECEQIIRKLPNFKEYLELPEYLNMVSLIEKGIAIHHSGVMPVLREMVEILYSKGYIKVLFATETFAVGINMPTKTVIFTDINKFDGKQNRMLFSHEYTQMAGRAGRRGIDTEGHVIHLNNLFRNVNCVNYKQMMNGKPQTLVSKFKISFNLLLNLIDNNDYSFLIGFTKKSMITNDLDNQMKDVYYNISNIDLELDNLKNYTKNIKTPLNVVNEYIDFFDKKEMASNKKRKELDRQISNYKDMYKFIEQDRNSLEKIKSKENDKKKLLDEYNNIEKYIDNNILIILDLLKSFDFIKESTQELQESQEKQNKYNLTLKGKIASQLREINCLVFAELIKNKLIENFTSKQLVILFSCFTNINVNDDNKDIRPDTQDKEIKSVLLTINELYTIFQDKEVQYNINTGSDYAIHYDLINYVDKWCDCQNESECHDLLQRLSKEKEVFLGEFVKALLKINNISSEMENIAEIICNVDFLNKLRKIPEMTLKFVVTNQSLYV
jgi:superfamily II RNA helicase